MGYKDKEKQKEYNKKWRKNHPDADKGRYKNNPEYFKANNNKNRKIKHKFIWDYKSKNPCIICGESAPECLDFHHEKLDEKYKNISDMAKDNNSIGSIKKEINKCIILCCNCHRKEHYLTISR